MSQIFISHIEEEETIAREIASGLQGAGYTVWYYERDSYPGADYLDQVSNAIEGCEAVLVLISPDSISSRQIEDEVKWARELRKNFVPVLHGMSWGQFQERKVRWHMALGIVAGVVIPKEGVGAILPRVLRGLENLGVRSAPAIESKSDKGPLPRSSPEPAPEKLEPIPGITGEKTPAQKRSSRVTLRELRTLSGHSECVRAVAVTPDGQRAVSASDDKTLKVWDLQSGRELRTLSGHTFDVNDVALTSDGRRAVSASWDYTLKEWDLTNGRELRTFSGHSAFVRAVALTPDGQRAVSGSSDATLKVWDLESGHELRTLFGHSMLVEAVAVTSDGQRAVSASADKTLKVWDLTNGRELRTLSGHTDWMKAVALTPDGQRAVSASDDKTLKVWDLQSGRELRALSGHLDAVNGVAVTPDGQRAVSASRDQTLKVWELESGELLSSFTCQDKLVCCACFDDGKRIVAGDIGGCIHILHVEEDRSEAR